jgi:uncharacterized protein
MAANVLVDAGFLVALLVGRDTNHGWAVVQSPRLPPPWKTCDAALSEAFHLLGAPGGGTLAALLERRVVVPTFILGQEIAEIVKLMQKYVDVPISLADACLIRMTETLTDPVLLTTDGDFRIYRRHGRRTIPCVMPS